MRNIRYHIFFSHTNHPPEITVEQVAQAIPDPYADSSTVTLTAEAEPGAIFTGWSGACTGKGDCK